jgi:hypothetical protein
LIGVRVKRPATTDLEERQTMQLEIKTQGVEFVVSRAPQPKNDNDGRQKADRETGAPLHVTELVAMDETGAEVIKVTTAGEPKVIKRQLVTVVKLVATPWNIDGRGGVAFRADGIVPVPATPAAHRASAAAAGAGS